MIFLNLIILELEAQTQDMALTVPDLLLISYFGRINYSLKNKYLLTVTGREDGSSKFGANNKYAFFPSAALAWKVSDENFLKNNSAISNLKLRTSYGVTGNSEIPAYSSLSTLNPGYAAIINDQRIGSMSQTW